MPTYLSERERQRLAYLLGRAEALAQGGADGLAETLAQLRALMFPGLREAEEDPMAFEPGLPHPLPVYQPAD